MVARRLMRCLSCKGEFEPDQKNYFYMHQCPPEIRNPGGKIIKTPNPRNENIIQEIDEEEESKQLREKGQYRGTVHIKAEGLGVERI